MAAVFAKAKVRTWLAPSESKTVTGVEKVSPTAAPASRFVLVWTLVVALGGLIVPAPNCNDVNPWDVSMAPFTAG